MKSPCLNVLGDPPAAPALLGDLAANYQQRVYRFVLRHVGHVAEAEDLAQQALAEAVRTFSSFRGDSTLSTWLHGIAMNLVRNHLSRAPQRRYQFEDEGALDDIAASTANPEQLLEIRQLLNILDGGLADLMPEMREVLLLVALDDMSYDGAALKLAVPVGTVRSRVARARAKLRQRFEAEGADLPF